ncbi:hypothetical protein [Cellulomonas cellasea]|uniref:Uncharacterized protein n=1 Tax=Cellulomonas cellasea TaxID=43670 RepID=A0A7W4UJI3_9CELL|nr:hypothetical protein [Cellulomonas cellasea]MBB2924678.1 hypothetical protein [Cellulomonas cellasea]
MTSTPTGPTGPDDATRPSGRGDATGATADDAARRAPDAAGDPRSSAPHEPVPDAAFDRVRAADPAASTVADLPALRQAVTARAAADASGVRDLGAARDARAARRPARWLQVAAAVAGAAVIGSGAYALGRGDAPTPAAAPVTLDPAGRAAAPASGAESMAMDQSVADTKMIAPGFWGRTVFTGSGLSEEGGSARAWTFDPASVFSQETAERVAGVLGVEGGATRQWGAWTVGAQDGTGPNVQLQPDGLASLSYSDPTRDPWSCVRSAPETPDVGRAEPGTDAGAAEPGTDVADPDGPATSGSADGAVGPDAPALAPCAPEGSAPSGDDASAQTRDLLGRLGVDASGYELEVASDPGQPAATTVYAHQVLDGQRSGVSWSLTFVADGVQALYGSLAPVVELGEYDVVSPAAAVERLMDPRFGSSPMGVMPLAGQARAALEQPMVATEDLDAAVSPDGAGQEPTVPPLTPAGSPVSWPVQEVTLTSARLGLATVAQADGSSVLVPSYELTDDEGSAWSVVALTDDGLDFAAR